MPKRRFTTARQQAAARANLVKARAAKRRRGVPTGKRMLLVHHTSPANARAIAAGGFTRSDQGRVWFTNWRNEPSNRMRGKGLVSVAVPRKHAEIRSTQRLRHGRLVPVKENTGTFYVTTQNLKRTKVKVRKWSTKSKRYQ